MRLALLFTLFSFVAAQDEPPKPSDKSITAVMHIFQGRSNSAVIISRGGLPDVVGAEGLTLVEDLTGLEQGARGFTLDGQGFGSTGGGHLGENTLVYEVAEGALTVDMEDCADFDFNSIAYEDKSNNPLKVFGVLNGGTHIVLPYKKDRKPGDLLEGKAVIDDRGAVGLDDLFDKVPDGTVCTVSWMNGNGNKQTLKLIVGKNLKSVNTIIAIVVAVMAGAAALAGFYVFQEAKK